MKKMLSKFIKDFAIITISTHLMVTILMGVKRLLIDTSIYTQDVSFWDYNMIFLILLIPINGIFTLLFYTFHCSRKAKSFRQQKDLFLAALIINGFFWSAIDMDLKLPPFKEPYFSLLLLSTVVFVGILLIKRIRDKKNMTKIAIDNFHGKRTE